MNFLQETIRHFLNKVSIEKQWSDHTVRSYQSDLYQFAEIVNCSLEKFKDDTFLKYYRWLSKNFTEPSTKNRKLIIVKQFVRYLNRKKLLPTKLSVSNAKLFKKKKHTVKKHAFTQQVFGVLIERVERRRDWRAYALFMTLRYLGLRSFEVLSLKCEFVKNKKIPMQGKGEKDSDLYIPERVIDAWQKYLRQRQGYKPNDPLFITRNGTPLQYPRLYKIVKYYSRGFSPEVEAVCHPHSFRHLFITDLIREYGVEFAAQVVGHADIRTTIGYNDITEDEIIKKLEELWNRRAAQEKELAKSYKQSERQAARDAKKLENGKKKRGRPKGTKKTNTNRNKGGRI